MEYCNGINTEIKTQNLTYQIDGVVAVIEGPDRSQFFYGEDIFLSDYFNDITREKNWYNQGFDVIDTKPFLNIQKVKDSLTNCLYQICKAERVNVNKETFNLDDYHKYVTEEKHIDIVKKTRQLEPKDFEFDLDLFLAASKHYFNRELSWMNSGGYNPKIITRINKPQSNHFNPPHKDIYQVYDETREIPPMVNIWIPICGVNNGVGLPVAPGSHLINESKIFRTRAGATVNGLKFNVNCVKDWNSVNDMVTICPSESEMIVFSSFLIHGLARNTHHDMTRMALEFRLFG